MSERDPLLQEREKTHGSFKHNAKLWTDLVAVVPTRVNNFPCEQQLAICMIMLKLSRIMSGQASVLDHWDDIAGYAKLAAETCPPSNPPSIPGGITHVERPR